MTRCTGERMKPEHIEPVQTAQQLLDMADAFKKSRILLSAVELDVFSALERADTQSMTAAEAAAACGTDARGMDRLLRACCALGLLQFLGQDRFANTPASRSFLVRGSPEFLGSLDHLNTLFGTWSRLTPSVRKGGTVMNEPDMSTRDGSWFEPFMAAMYSRGRKGADELVSRLDLQGVASVLDLGGGPGAHAMAFARAGKEAGRDIRVTVFDLPQVTPITRRYLEKDDMQHAVSTRDGDFRRDPLHLPDGSGYDLVFVSAIVHMLSPKENLKLLQKVHDAVNPGGRAAVLDFVMDEDRLHPVFGALFSINMLVSTEHGDSYTRSEISGWMEEAGFTDIQRIDAPGATAYIQGVKPA